jgi:hypothetical protein
MGVLLRELCERRYHSQELGDGIQGQATGGASRAVTTEVRDGERNQTVPSWMEPNHTDSAQVPIRDNVKQRQAQAVERMGGVDDLDRLCRQR